MKKALSLVLAVALLALSAVSFAACGEKHVCTYCKEEKRGCEVAEVFGQKLYTCPDCKAEMEKLGDELGDIGDELEDLGNELGDLFS